jgi:hypothetical protein
MDVLEKKAIPQEILQYVQPLQYDNNQIFLMGSGALLRMKYPADIDLMTQINHDAKMYSKIKIILDKTDKIDNMYFIEGKVQMKNGKKMKWYGNGFKKAMTKDHNNISFIKLDYVVMLNGIFTELSIIYSVDADKQSDADIIKAVKEDFDDYISMGEWYKALKRLFSIIKLKNSDPQHKVLAGLEKFFNSEYGKLYKTNNILKAIILYRGYYKDEKAKENAKYVYKNLGYSDNISNINNHIDENAKIYNDAGKKYYQEHHLASA